LNIIIKTKSDLCPKSKHCAVNK